MKTVARLTMTVVAAAVTALAVAFSGPSASANTVTFYTNQTAAVPVGMGHENDAWVFCNPGDSATGGGGMLEWGNNTDAPYMRVVQSTPAGSSGGGAPTAWWVQYHNDDTQDVHRFFAYVVCAHTVAGA